MKKKILTVSTVLAVMLFTGCGGTDKSTRSISTNLGENIDLSTKSITTQTSTISVKSSQQTPTLSTKSTLQTGINFTITKYIKKDTVIGKVESAKFDGEILSLSLCGDFSNYFSVEKNGTLKLKCDLPEDFEEATLKVEANIKKDGTCKNVEDEISIKIVLGEVEDISIATSFMAKNSLFNTLGFYGTNYWGVSVTLSKDNTKAFVVTDPENDYHGLKILDVSNPKKPILLSSWGADDRIKSVALSEDNTKAFIAHSKIGLEIIDITDLQNPKLLGSLDTDGEVYSVVLSSDNKKAYIADRYKGLKIIDISDAKNPKLLSSLGTNDNVAYIAISSDNTKVYLGDWNKSFKIIDISDAKNPKLLGSLDTDGWVRSIVLSDDNTKAYVADQVSLKIIDITNSTNPKLIGSLNTDYASSIALYNDNTKVFLADGYDGHLKIIDITNPKNPKLLSSLRSSNFIYPIYATLSNDNTKAFVADFNNGLKIIDLISDTIEKTKDFGDGFIELNFTKSLENAEISISADRDDIVKIGEYEKSFSMNGVYNIPISSLPDMTGKTVLTVKVKKDGKVGTRKIYINVI